MALLEQDLEPDVAPQILTYERYLAEGTVYGRYDIINGVRYPMPNPTPLHQEVCANIFERLRAFQRLTDLGRTFMAPRDVRISYSPLRARQHDVLFITHARMGGQSLEDPATFPQAPELVVEVLSPSDTLSVKQDKIVDFCAAGVTECWLVSLSAESVEVLRLTPAGPERIALYGTGDALQSLTFPELTLSVSDIFSV